MKKLERLRHRFKRALREQLSLRFHMFLLLMAVFVFAAGLSWVLHRAGLTSLPWRYGLVTLLAYGALFLFVRLWLYYLVDTEEVRAQAALVDRAATTQAASPRTAKARASTGPSGDAVEDVVDLAEEGADAVGDLGGSGGGGSGGGGSGGSFDVDVDGEGAAILIVVAIVLAVVFSLGVYLIYQAPLILSDALFQVVLAGAIQRSARKLDTEHWAASLWRATWWTLALALLVTVVGGALLQHYCPGATKMSQAIRHCVGK